MDVTPTSPDAADPDRMVQDAAYYRGVLHAMIDMGMALLAEQQGKGGESPAEVAAPDLAAEIDPSVAYARITRSIRRSIMLAQRLDEPARAVVPHPARQRQATRARIIREVEDMIVRHADEDEGALQAEFRERLDSPELEDDLGDRPVAEIITEICRDLGLMIHPGANPWKRRSPADVAALRALAARPTRPDWANTPGPPKRQSRAGCRDP